MPRCRIRARSVVALALLGVAAACTAAPVSPERLQAESRRLLAPYDEPRTVVADEIHFDISPNFDAAVARPAISPGLAELAHSVDGGDDLYRWSSSGNVQMPLRFMVGRTTFAALTAATLRVRGSGKPMALSTTARGQVTEAVSGAPDVHCQEVTIVDGVHVRR